jgi:hypothetical protein
MDGSRPPRMTPRWPSSSRFSSSSALYTVPRAIDIYALASAASNQLSPRALHASVLHASVLLCRPGCASARELFKPTPLRTFCASVGGPWPPHPACSNRSNITLRLRSRWDVEAGSCRREYFHRNALPLSGSFSLEEPRLFSHQGFLWGYRGFDAPGLKGKAAGARPLLTSCLTLPFLSLPHTAYTARRPMQ